jgi:hypothetical protein
MMSIKDALLKAKQTLNERVENALGHGEAISPMAVRRDILNQVESKIIVDPDGKSLPFGRVVVRLQPQTARQHAALEEAFVREDALKKHLLQTLQGLQIQCPKEFDVRVELQEVSGPEGTSSRALFEIDFVRLHVLRLEEVPETKLLVIRGTAEQSVYQMKKDRILVGRPAEVLDREGRIVRKNDIVFLENEDEIDASVGNVHARIWFDYEKREFWIMDEGSRYGTRILRGGLVIEVPGEDPVGVQLQSGDDLYFGQAITHFEVNQL